mmetsp:Transcript_2230/g.5272  ORF Transcript_2230/g.5272 Transcript_2230/m.5272 type:complete len:391 (-) Transcript_2230:805-1977(-)
MLCSCVQHLIARFFFFSIRTPLEVCGRLCSSIHSHRRGGRQSLSLENTHRHARALETADLGSDRLRSWGVHAKVLAEVDDCVGGKHGAGDVAAVGQRRDLLREVDGARLLEHHVRQEAACLGLVEGVDRLADRRDVLRHPEAAVGRDEGGLQARVHQRPGLGPRHGARHAVPRGGMVDPPALEHIQAAPVDVRVLHRLVDHGPFLGAPALAAADLLRVHLARAHHVEPVPENPSCLDGGEADGGGAGWQGLGQRLRALLRPSRRGGGDEEVLDPAAPHEEHAPLVLPAGLDRPVDVRRLLGADEVAAAELLMPQLPVLDHVEAPVGNKGVLDVVIDDVPLHGADCLPPTDLLVVNAPPLKNIEPLVCHYGALHAGVYQGPFLRPPEVAPM